MLGETTLLQHWLLTLSFNFNSNFKFKQLFGAYIVCINQPVRQLPNTWSLCSTCRRHCFVLVCLVIFWTLFPLPNIHFFSAKLTKIPLLHILILVQFVILVSHISVQNLAPKFKIPPQSFSNSEGLLLTRPLKFEQKAGRKTLSTELQCSCVSFEAANAINFLSNNKREMLLLYLITKFCRFSRNITTLVVSSISWQAEQHALWHSLQTRQNCSSSIIQLLQTSVCAEKCSQSWSQHKKVWISCSLRIVTSSKWEILMCFWLSDKLVEGCLLSSWVSHQGKNMAWVMNHYELTCSRRGHI